MIRHLSRFAGPLSPLLALIVVALPAVMRADVTAQSRTFSSRVEAVRIDALVTSGGQPVLGLQASDFEISDNGVPQTASLVTFEQIPLNVVLALDMSGSLAGARVVELRNAGRAVVDALQPRDKAALVTFNGAVTVEAPLSENAAGVRAALNQPRQQGDTSLIDASYAAIVLAESDSARGLVIVFSDGQDTGSFLLADNVLTTAKRADTVVYAVSEPPQVEPLRGGSVPKFLSDLCEFTGGRVLEPGASNLGSTFLTVFNEFRQRYLISYTPRGVSPNGWHRLEVKLKGKRGTVKARPGYLAGP
jgi:VWFA-related protein